MKSFGDWSKQLGFSGVVLNVGLIVTTSSSAWTASPVAEMVTSTQVNREVENKDLPRVTTEPNLEVDEAGLMPSVNVADDTSLQSSMTSPPTPLLQGEGSLVSIGLDDSRFHTPPIPLVKGGAIKEYVSNSNPTGITPPSLVGNRSFSEEAGGLGSEFVHPVENRYNAVTEKMQLSQAETTPQPAATPNSAAEELDLSPEIIENSPVLQRWLEEVPNVLEDIRNDPSFRTRLRLGYSNFPSNDDASGFNVGVEDVFIGRTGLTVSGDYQASFNGDRQTFGADLRYYVLPLGSYVNVAPLVGYRNIESNDYSTDGINVGARLMLALSRTGAADVSLTQSFVSPGSSDEVGITTLSFGYAVTRNLRLSTDIQKQNSREEKDSRVGIVLEWMP
jgi:hypothetical protein